VDESLGGAVVVVVVSLFLQAPSMVAMMAALRMIFDAFEKAFIVNSSFTSILCRCLPAMRQAGAQQRQVSPAMSLIATPGNGTIRNQRGETRGPVQCTNSTVKIRLGCMPPVRPFSES
jgi:hypothetical protein